MGEFRLENEMRTEKGQAKDISAEAGETRHFRRAERSRAGWQTIRLETPF